MDFAAFSVSENGVFDSRVKFPRSMVTDPRPVEEYEIELYTEDQPGVSHIDGEHIPLKKGTLICAKPGMTRYSRLPFKCLYMHLQTADSQLQQLLNRLPTCCEVADVNGLSALFHRQLTLDPNTFPEEQLLLQSCILELLYQLVQDVGVRRGEFPGTHRKTMQWVEQYIRRHLDQELDLKALADRANLSASYFHKIFTGHFGTTPAEYVLNCRMSAAKTMLMEGEMSMEEVAERCGFSSQSYFNYCFKQQTGQTPLQYRRASLSRLQP